MGGDEDDFVIAPDRDTKRRWIIALVVVTLLLLAAGAWALASQLKSTPTATERPGPIEPAQVTTPNAPSETTPAVSATQTAEPGEPTSTVQGSGTTTPTSGPRYCVRDRPTWHSG